MIRLNILKFVNGPVITMLYLGFYALLLVFIIIRSRQPSQSLKKNMKNIWRKRSIYGTVLVQIFDQASDIGVLILWWQYSIDEEKNNFDVARVSMQIMTYLSLISLILSRVASSFVVAFFMPHKNVCSMLFDSFLCLIELYVIKQVYIVHNQHNRSNESDLAINTHIHSQVKSKSFERNIIENSANRDHRDNKHNDHGMHSNNDSDHDNNNDTDTDNESKNNNDNNDNDIDNDDDHSGSTTMEKIEPTPEMRVLKWIEAIFESFPQALLQSVFIIRTFDSEFDIKNDNRFFFEFSLAWSIISTANKFISVDKRDTVFDMSTHKIDCSCKVWL